MVDLKSVIAKNIIALRKSKNWTQMELAQKINYSDKAVSKWERAESVPDVSVLKEIASHFQVTVDYLLEEDHAPDAILPPALSKVKRRNRLIIALVTASSLFLAATILYVVTGLFSIPFLKPAWMIYIYAIPAAVTVLLVFNSIWGSRKLSFAIITLLLWTTLLALYLSAISHDIWLIFIIGIPAQVIILLCTRFKIIRPLQPPPNG